MPTVVVVDDAADVRLLMKTRLRVSGSFKVVGEGADGAQAVALAEQHEPALMLLDVSMPGVARGIRFVIPRPHSGSRTSLSVPIGSGTSLDS